jgi:hypothetical protein
MEAWSNKHIKLSIGINSYGKVKTFTYLGFLLANQNSIKQKKKCIDLLKAGNSCYCSEQTFLFSRILT